MKGRRWLNRVTHSSYLFNLPSHSDTLKDDKLESLDYVRLRHKSGRYILCLMVRTQLVCLHNIMLTGMTLSHSRGVSFIMFVRLSVPPQIHQILITLVQAIISAITVAPSGLSQTTRRASAASAATPPEPTARFELRVTPYYVDLPYCVNGLLKLFFPSRLSPLLSFIL